MVAGITGAAIGWLLSFPIYPITGPAVFISLLCVAGIRCAIVDPVRDIALLFIGISIGTGINAQAASAVATWPIAFAVLALMITCVLLFCRFILMRFFGFDPRSATLAAAPGHLSYVLSLSSTLNIDITPIAVVQAVRLLALTLCVPIVALIFGIEVSAHILPSGSTMSLTHVAILLPVSSLLAVILQRLNIPAAFLIGGMVVSSIAQITELTPGSLSPSVVLPCLVVVGVMIGTRFSGVTLKNLLSSLGAGLVTTFATVIMACLAAVPVALLLEMPAAQVIVAFSPGGLETMVAMGAVLGANAGFVTACHVGRLFLLTLLVPIIVGRKQQQSEP